jgi:hypothetical protein
MFLSELKSHLISSFKQEWFSNLEQKVLIYINIEMNNLVLKISSEYSTKVF